MYPSLLRATRRGFLEASLLSGLGLAFAQGARGGQAKAMPTKAKACILIWLNGGPSHIDTFDPKPGTETGGPFGTVATQMAGVRFCEHLKRLAAVSDRLAVIRSLHSKEEDHDRAYRMLHTGSIPTEAVDMPSLGALLAREAHSAHDLPRFVSLLGESHGPGFLGLEFAPLVVNDLDNPIPNLTPGEGVDAGRLRRRLTAVARLNQSFAARTDGPTVADLARLTDQAVRLAASPDVGAFQLSEEPAEVLERYGAAGDNPLFGRACILARRLVERGTAFVEVRLDGWDTHENNFASVGNLLAQLDPALAALISELSERGLLDQTLLVCMGEFGRTPQINPQNGRDHWAHVFSALVAGGGVAGGQVIGASDALGAEVADRPVTVPDLIASLLWAAGSDPQTLYTTPEGRPVRIADGGEVVRELFG